MWRQEVSPWWCLQRDLQSNSFHGDDDKSRTSCLMFSYFHSSWPKSAIFISVLEEWLWEEGCGTDNATTKKVIVIMIITAINTHFSRVKHCIYLYQHYLIFTRTCWGSYQFYLHLQMRKLKYRGIKTMLTKVIEHVNDSTWIWSQPHDCVCVQQLHSVPSSVKVYLSVLYQSCSGREALRARCWERSK